jgi:16S rRNA (guanine527-N7)-methyltransferase
MTAEDLQPIERTLSLLGETLSRAQASTLSEYRDLIAQLNARYSLVSRGDTARIVSRHFVESLELLRWMPHGALKVADLGSGGGLPGIPIKILRPEATIALLERRHRKQVFLRLALHRLGIQGAAVFSGVENLAGDYAPPFDRVVARAVGPLAAILPHASALLRAGGLLIAPKGSRAREDLAAAAAVLPATGFEVEEDRSQSLTSKNEPAIHRAVLVFRKTVAS